MDNDDNGAFPEAGDRAPAAAAAPGAESAAAVAAGGRRGRGGGGDVGGAARYAEGPSTRMNLFTAVNAGLRTAMETDETAVRRRGPGLSTMSGGGKSFEGVDR